MSSTYNSVFSQSIQNKEDFWSKAAEDVRWIKKPTQILDASNPPFYKWFKGGKINTCFNALDRHVEEGNGDRTAIIFDSAMTGVKKKYSYQELTKEVSILAGALQAHGVQKGDRVIIYMPMIPESIMAMLACARIGAVHSVVFGGFASAELASRIDDSGAKVILSASCGLEPGKIVEYKPLLEDALKKAKHKIEKVVIFQRDSHQATIDLNFIDWKDFVKNAKPAECVSCDANDPAYILYTSGTTGTPKGILRDIGGHVVALKWTMKNVYDINPDDVWWSASDIGWIVGHSYIVYAPLFHGCTSIVFEGKPVGTPDPGTFWRIISEYKVKTLLRMQNQLNASVVMQMILHTSCTHQEPLEHLKEFYEILEVM